MSRIEQYNGTSSAGTAIKAVYAEQPSANVAFALVFPGGELPRLIHWGRPVTHPETFVAAYDALKPQRVSGALDETAWPSILPTQSESWIGEPRLTLRRDGVEVFCKFAVADVTVSDSVITVAAADAEQGVGLTWICELTASGLIRQKAAITNLADGALEVGKVELGFSLPAAATEILTTTGHHLRERSPQRQSLTVGRFAKAQLAGRPDFDATLLTSVGVPGFGFESGEVWSLHVAWSGNAVSAVERLPYTQAVVSGGELLFGGEVTLAKDESYDTPWVFGSYGDGLNEVSARFHEYLREVHPALFAKPRPVILNTWEAVYFNHDFDTLKALADKAAASGVERFVVDDGWFGARRDDTKGLGDWWIAPEVWPEGPKSLKALADYVHAKGMEFGLWFEPEMVNPDSDMARNHPDWIMAPTPNRLPMQGRTQQVVDLTNPDAYAYVFGAMDKLVGELGIDYIKWDHNKLVTEGVSQRTGKPAVHAQTLAVYDIFRTLKANHPGLEIESCSSGGGRVDLGILEVADRIWASDCVDPVERADIQRYTSLLVPPAMMGQHVGASPAHSTHRPTSQELRMAMAFFGHMGIEWNLNIEPEEALAKLAVWVDAYKAHRADFAAGTAVHGDSADPAVRLDGVVSADGERAVYRFTQLTTSQTYPTAPVRLPGLKPDALYRVRPMAQSADLSWIGNGQSLLGWWTEEGVVLPGSVLETYGLRPPTLHPAQAVLFEASIVPVAA